MRKRLNDLVPVCVVFHDVISEGAYERAAETFGLSVRLWMICDSEVVLDPQRSANGIEELGDELPSVVHKDVIRRTVSLNPVFKECLSDIGSGSFS